MLLPDFIRQNFMEKVSCKFIKASCVARGQSGLKLVKIIIWMRYWLYHFDFKMIQPIAFIFQALKTQEETDIKNTCSLRNFQIRRVRGIARARSKFNSLNRANLLLTQGSPHKLRSQLCAYFYALNMNKNFASVVQVIPCAFVRVKIECNDQTVRKFNFKCCSKKFDGTSIRK